MPTSLGLSERGSKGREAIYIRLLFAYDNGAEGIRQGVRGRKEPGPSFRGMSAPPLFEGQVRSKIQKLCDASIAFLTQAPRAWRTAWRRAADSIRSS